MPRGKHSSCQRWHILFGTCLMRKLSCFCQLPKIRSRLSYTTQSLHLSHKTPNPPNKILLPGSLILIKCTSFNLILGGCYKDKGMKSYLISWMLLRRGRNDNRFFRPLFPKQFSDRLTDTECGVKVMSETTWVAAKTKERLTWTGDAETKNHKNSSYNVGHIWIHHADTWWLQTR